MQTSTYQSIKLVALKFFGISKDAMHIHFGFFIFLITALITKKKLSSFMLLLPGFIFSLLMEALDLRDDLSSLGYARWSASLHDIINTNLIPIILVTCFRLKKIKSRLNK